MKKIIIILLAMFTTVFVFAQEDETYDEPGTVLKNSKGMTILPEMGDISVGVNLVPFMNYLGNIGNDNIINGFPSSSFLFNSGTTMFVKYFNSNNTAFRAKLGIEYANEITDRYVQDDAAVYVDPLSELQVTDRMIETDHAYYLALGYEFRRGKGRLQAAYGAELGLGYYNYKRTYEYGNTFTDINTMPSTFNFTSYTVQNVDRRPLTDQNFRGIGFGANAFLQLEYYFLPNIAIGTEFALGPYFMKGFQTNHTDEYWNGSSIQEQTLLDSPGDIDFYVDFFRPTANFFLMFNF
jgi:hypothetical protein